MHAKLSKKIFICIDALDECGDQDKWDVIDSLQRLANSPNPGSNQGPVNITYQYARRRVTPHERVTQTPKYAQPAQTAPGLFTPYNRATPVSVLLPYTLSFFYSSLVAPPSSPTR